MILLCKVAVLSLRYSRSALICHHFSLPASRCVLPNLALFSGVIFVVTAPFFSVEPPSPSVVRFTLAVRCMSAFTDSTMKAGTINLFQLALGENITLLHGEV